MDDVEYPVSEEPLGALLREVQSGAIQVPEFQRAVLLRDDWVGTLLASVSLGYPIGALMLLEAGHPGYRFGTRAVDGAAQTHTAPRRLLVDGQHRASALFQALLSAHGVYVTAEGEVSRRRYYLDAAKVVAGVDRDEAVVSLPADNPPGSGLVPFAGAFDAGANVAVARIAEYAVPVIRLPMEATRWTIRVRGGANGAALSEAYRMREG